MPRMPLSGVRISWLTMARKRLLARLAASAWSRASASARSASARSVTSRPTLCVSVRSSWSARTSASRQAIQRGPSADAIFWSCTRAPSGRSATSPCSSTGRPKSLPMSSSRGSAGERAEGVVGVGDAAVAVAPHDHVALRFEEALDALLGFLDLPGAVGEFLEPQLEPVDLVALVAVAADQQRERAAGRDGGAGEQRHVGVEIQARDAQAVIGDQPIQRQHRERRARRSSPRPRPTATARASSRSRAACGGAACARSRR